MFFRCKKPYHSDTFYEKDKEQIRCNSCFTKLQKEREKRVGMKREKEEEEDEEERETAPPLPKTAKPSSTFEPQQQLPAGFSKSKMAFIPVFFK